MSALDLISTPVRNYLIAVNAHAVYVTTMYGVAHSVGTTRDLERSLIMMRIKNPDVDFFYIAWVRGEKAAAKIIETKNILRYRRHDGILVARNLPDVIKSIEEIASHHKITLTKHQAVIDRATILSGHVDHIFRTLQDTKQLQHFNKAYRSYRLQQVERGESAVDYRFVLDRLKQIIIRSLLGKKREKNVDYFAIMDEFNRQFPWFRSYEPPQVRKKRATPYLTKVVNS